MFSLTPDVSLLVIMAIFIVNCIVVSKYLLRPINRILQERRAEIRDADLRFENALAAFNEATASMEAKIQDAKREASRLRDTFRTEASTQRQSLLEKTRDEAGKRIQAAEQDLSAHVETARRQIDEQAEALGRFAAEKIVGRKLA